MPTVRRPSDDDTEIIKDLLQRVRRLEKPTGNAPKVIGQIDLLTQPAFGLATGGITNSTTLPLYDRGFRLLGGRSLQVGPILSRHQPGAAPGLIIDVQDTAAYAPLSFVSWTITDDTFTNGVQLYASGISLADLTAGQFSANTQVGTGISTSNNRDITIPSGIHNYYIFFAYNTAT